MYNKYKPTKIANTKSDQQISRYFDVHITRSSAKK